MGELAEMAMDQVGALPGWVPKGARHYIAHTEKGAPIRMLARAAGCHASTILRQIRKVEMRRDDPLVDAALRKLSSVGTVQRLNSNTPARKDNSSMTKHAPLSIPDEDTLSREALRVLRRLCETGAVLAVAAGLDKAVVVRDTALGSSTRTAVVDTAVAQAMALKDWIAPCNTGRIVRYAITGTGRAALIKLYDTFGIPNEPAPSDEHDAELNALEGSARRDAEGEGGNRNRYAVGESPLSALSRRRDKSGKPFLDDALVGAGERLREDFELAQMDRSVAQNWDHFLTAGTQNGSSNGGGGVGAASEARRRVGAALEHLGEGLSDVALRCCCYLEGLETTEKRLGWSARSGKVVLRIALMRLQRHYDETVGPGGPMIG
ncbi:hypothetical protein Z946_4058 [Sulfitobacter noctilucicola]|uniref:DUF6456 domain-containing protein n=1 Tax=Sulfitobacter noctilucicola TaxID=1342301 RepID=A0A7W6Q3K9_9RHOB|nr:DUF6456 domain-containing protein [Sulfitobacter noctilucicola]KIN65158.1 hypothetical protein Z946_4058 [Sulfitobacter noctilucicola]MBB4173708.1 hypothetical protein [Sulfitobacter noctilucicola]